MDPAKPSSPASDAATLDFYAAGRDRFGRYFNYFDTPSLIDAYAASAAWEIFPVIAATGGGYDGVQGPWLALSARRPTSGGGSE